MAMFALFLEFRVTTRLRPFLISETGLYFLILTQGEIGPNNRAHEKRPFDQLKAASFFKTSASRCHPPPSRRCTSFV